VISLSASDYQVVLGRMASWGLTGGAAYDALHVRAAEVAGANALYTFNGRDFRRMAPEAPVELVTL
jgi:predicted nucleic acid-binding protein